jgi:hypothetical protein
MGFWGGPGPLTLVAATSPSWWVDDAGGFLVRVRWVLVGSFAQPDRVVEHGGYTAEGVLLMLQPALSAPCLKQAVRALALRCGGRELVSAGDDGRLVAWDAAGDGGVGRVTASLQVRADLRPKDMEGKEHHNRLGC